MDSTELVPVEKRRRGARKGTKHPRRTHYRGGDVSQREIRENINQIAALMSRGYGEQEIRSALGLGKRRYDYCLKTMSKMVTVDHENVWARYLVNVMQNQQDLDRIGTRAETAGRYKEAVMARTEIARLHRAIIDVGQSLGIIDKRRDGVDLNVTMPTLGMFHEVDVTEVRADLEEHDAGLYGSGAAIPADGGSGAPRLMDEGED